MKPFFIKRTRYTMLPSFKPAQAGILAAWLVFLALLFVSRAGGANDVNRILNALSQNRVQLENIKITARETNVVFNEYNPVFRLLDSNSHLSKRDIEKIKPLLSKSSDIVTTVRTHIYQFRKDLVLTTSPGLDEQTRQIEERTLVTASDVFVSRSFLGRDGNTNVTAMGEIYPRAGDMVVGWPCFLSKSILAQWINNGAGADCSLGLSSQGIDCYVVSLPPFTQSGGMNYKLFVRKDDLNPVELGSYSADGKPYSISQLEFGGNDHPSFCKRATTRIFNGSHVFKETAWNLIAIEKDDTPLIESIDSFFAEGTQISDMRFFKPIAYTKGTRLPNAEEIKGMLESPRGVVHYQLATHSDAELAKLAATASRLGAESKRKTNAIRILIVCVALAPVLMAILWAFKSRRKTVSPLR